MKILQPFPMTDAVLVASSVPENDHAEWNSGTTYAAGDFCIKAATHMIYQSLLGGNLNNDPESTLGTYWSEYSATNRWKAFDNKLADQSEMSSSVHRWDFAPITVVNCIAFFNVGAPEVRVRIYDGVIGGGGSLIYDQTENMVDDSDIIDYYTLVTTDLDDYKTEVIFDDFTIVPGYEFRVNIGDATGTSQVGEIAWGKTYDIGETMDGTEIGVKSYSVKETDDFGNWIIVPRAQSRPAEFIVSSSAGSSGYILRIMENIIDVPVVAYTSEDLVDSGLITFGFIKDFKIQPKEYGHIVNRVKFEALT